MSEKPVGEIDRSRRLFLKGVFASSIAFFASLYPDQAQATRELGDLSPDELLERIRTELQPGGYMREWLEEKRGRVSSRDVHKFFQSLMPIIEELERVRDKTSRYTRFRELSFDPNILPHLYTITITPKEALKAKSGNASLVGYKGRIYFVTAAHVVQETQAVSSFYAYQEGGHIVDLVAVPVDMQQSNALLKSIRRPGDTSPFEEVLRVPDSGDAPRDRGGTIMFFASEMRGEFDFAPRLCIPMTSAIARAWWKFRNPKEPELKQSPEMLADMASTTRQFDVVTVGPRDFSHHVGGGILAAQGRSGGTTYDESPPGYTLSGTFIALSTEPVKALGDRPLLFVNKSGQLARLLEYMHEKKTPPVALGAIPGLQIKPISRFQTTVERAKGK